MEQNQGDLLCNNKKLIYLGPELQKLKMTKIGLNQTGYKNWRKKKTGKVDVTFLI